MNTSELIFFGGFLLFIFFILMLDLGVFNKKNHVVSFKEAGIWTFVWVSLSIALYFLIRTHGEWIHGISSFEELQAINIKHAHNLALDSSLGIDANLQLYRNELALEYITGYVIEYALSVDNVFIMIMIFMSFGIEQKYYHKILFWGIIGAVVMRFLFIFLSSALIHRFNWILWFFGALLIFTGVKMFIERNKDDKIDKNKHPIIRFASKYLSVFPRNVGDRFFIRKKDGKIHITILFLTLLVIEFTDVIFAVDSVPAIFSITKDPYIVFFSNIFAIIGLRSLFFLLNNVVNLFCYLKIGLSALLTFIGVKMLLHSIFHIEIATSVSLLIIVGILAISIIFSLLFPQKKATEVPVNTNNKQ